jgi:hypothetical protein
MPNKFSKKKNKVKKVKIMYGGLICQNSTNKAYHMSGHGGSTINIYDVPDDCVYITTAMCGNITTSSVLLEFYHFLKNNPDIVKNPCDTNNFNTINQVLSRNSEASYYIGNTKTNDTTGNPKNSNFLNMHISKKTCETSAKCPKKYLFQYKDAYYLPCLYAIYNKKVLLEEMGNTPPIHDTITIQYSGLISADNSFEEMKTIQMYEPTLSVWKCPMIRISNIKEIYKYSVYPEISDILAKITELNIQRESYLKITDPTDEKYYDLNSGDEFMRKYYDSFIMSGYDFIKMIKQHFAITQSQLFRRFPGVHYNTLCRPFDLLFGPYSKEGQENPFYSKNFQRQSSVDNRQNLLELYDEESASAAAASDSASAAAASDSASAAAASDSASDATASDASTSPKIQAMLKREGGKKNKNKNKTKKYYKNKRTRKNKTKRSYKK